MSVVCDPYICATPSVQATSMPTLKRTGTRLRVKSELFLVVRVQQAQPRNLRDKGRLSPRRRGATGLICYRYRLLAIVLEASREG
jgi:hypothetical protein